MENADPRCPACFHPAVSDSCPTCGWREGTANAPPALAQGILLDGRYRVGRVLGHGGFGITYLGWDIHLETRRAIKEYLPSDLATRAPGTTQVAIFSGERAEQYHAGLERFLREAQTLAQFELHPGIVNVVSFFSDHATGYMVMEYLDGVTLRHYLEQQGGRIDLAAATQILMPVMDALRAVHKAGLLHRDIAPDNIYITREGMVKLLDFGAARQSTQGQSRSLSVILKPGYAPYEQYRSRAPQGPYSDLYALCATLYRCITGMTPPEALERHHHESLEAPSVLGVKLNAQQEAVILKGLALEPEQRYQQVEALQQALRAAALGIAQPPPPAAAAPPPSAAPTASKSNRLGGWLFALLLLGGLLGGGFYWQQEREQKVVAEVEVEQRVQAALAERERLAEVERQREAAAAEAARQAQAERERLAEVERQREAAAARQAQTERERLAEVERQREAAAAERQAQAERERLAEVERQAQTERDRRAWERATESDSEAAYRAYLNRCTPDGCGYRQEAEEKIAEQQSLERSRLTIVTEPRGARVRIMNIVPPYRDGIELEVGSYDLEISAPGYQTQREWRTLTAGDQVVEIALREVVEAEQHAQVEQEQLTEIEQRRETAEVEQRVQAEQKRPAAQEGLIQGRYRDNGDGTVTDVITKLQWMRCAVGQRWRGGTCSGEVKGMNWDAANREDADNFAGYTDWRLPTIEELKGLVYCSSGKPRSIGLRHRPDLPWREREKCEGEYQRPTIDLTAFPRTLRWGFWSSSASSSNSSFAWYVDFYYGDGSGNRSSNHAVRLVRGGQ